MIFAKFTEPVVSDAISGLRCSMPPRSLPMPLRPPVENCTIMPGQCLRIPVEEPPELLGIRRRRAVVVADVHVHERGAGLVRGVRRLDLLGRR